jgi:hypothetical protein
MYIQTHLGFRKWKSFLTPRAGTRALSRPKKLFHQETICYRIELLGFDYKLLGYKPKGTDGFRNGNLRLNYPCGGGTK